MTGGERTGRWQLLTGKAEELLKTYPDNHFDAMVTDPPASISFMGKDWDSDKGGIDGWVQWLTLVMREALRTLKPGAHGLVWSIPRRCHWTGLALEAAGFEIRDAIVHLVGNRMPKSLNASKAIDRKLGVGSPEAEAFEGYGTGLRALQETWFLVRKPLDGTVVQNALRWGTGCLNINGTRIGLSGGTRKVKSTNGAASVGAYGDGMNGRHGEPIDGGRWPANVILDEHAALDLDAFVGHRPSTLTGRADESGVYENTGDNHGSSSFGGGNSSVYADDGGPSRFMYTTKVSTREREAGCEHLPLHSAGENVDREEGSVGINNGRAGAGRTGARHNQHPTLKPISLTQYLAKLVLPPNRGEPRRMFTPFAGAGSEMIGAALAGFEECHGTEQDPDFVTIANARLEYWTKNLPRHDEEDARQTLMFGGDDAIRDQT